MGGSSTGPDNNGCTFPDELCYILKNSFMIRRLKSEVLSNLPTISRKLINIEVPPKFHNKITNFLSRYKLENLGRNLKEDVDP